MKGKVIVAGGGIIGLFSAYYLHRLGYQVLVVDKSDLSDSCSYGNAGLIVPSHIVPLASPGMVSTAMKHLLNSKAPVGIKMPPSLDFLQWSLRFLKTANRQFVRESSVVLKDLTSFSQSLYQHLAKEGEFPFQLNEKGLLMVCQTRQMLKEEAEIAHLANDLGVTANELSGDELRNMEPSLSENIQGGVYYPGDGNVVPPELMKNLITWLEQSGVIFLRNSSLTFIGKDNTVVINSKEYDFDALVISAGIWSNELLKLVGHKVPLQPGRGYSFELLNNAAISYPALLVDDRISVTPFNGDVTRFGGVMELGYSSHRVTEKRFGAMVRSIQRNYPPLPLIKEETLNVWSGHRPCSFDGLPYIGQIPGRERIFLATGHSMLGITLAPATGKLISELVDGQQLSLNLHPFRINR